MQQLVARDGGSAGRGSGGGGDTDRGTVLGSGNAKEVAQPGGDLAVGGGGRGGGVREAYSWESGGQRCAQPCSMRTVVRGGCDRHTIRILHGSATWMLSTGTLVSMEWRQKAAFGRPMGGLARVPGFASNRAALCVASGRGVPRASLAAAARGGDGWWCTGPARQRPPSAGGGDGARRAGFSNSRRIKKWGALAG